jgi:hypothetical protein
MASGRRGYRSEQACRKASEQAMHAELAVPLTEGRRTDTALAEKVRKKPARMRLSAFMDWLSKNLETS